MDRNPVSLSGMDPEKHAWITNFFTENHLAFEVFPREVASPEQLKFIVYLEDNPLYYPCSDKIFQTIIAKKGGDILNLAYLRIWERLEPLMDSVVEDEYKKAYLRSLLRIKFRHETASMVMLPSRLEKRLLQIFVRVSEIDRPLASAKEQKNQRVFSLLNSEAYERAINNPEGLHLSPDTSLEDIRLQVLFLQIERLLALTAHPALWTDEAAIDETRLHSMFQISVKDPGWEWLKETLRQWVMSGQVRYMLWMGSSAGEVLLDLAIIRLLIKMGIKVIFSVKQAFYYDAVILKDLIECPYLQEAFSDAEIITERNISKNHLLDRLKSDKMLFVISDGTQERFNPLLTSVTFARAFKETDLVISRNHGDCTCLSETSFQFTRDIVAVTRPGPGRISISVKQRHPNVIRFSETDLREKADALIYHLKMQERQGKSIMFYSAIVGSIPQQLETAKKILKVFVDYLRKKLDGVVIINPAEHFEPGMDADDLMYMWEIVQRSGLIDIWRFQSVEDIEKAFELMGEKVPPEWLGKDATYSTGCTMEMKIARDVQKQYPEMQIIGPSWEKFQRRKEYGIGKLYDRVLEDI